MAEMSNYLEDALINGTLRGTTYTAPTTVYVGLYLTDPTDANTGTEVSGGSYSRTAVTFGAPSNGAALNNAAVEFPQCTVDWGTITHIGILDAVSTGNLLYHTPLDVSKTISTGDILSLIHISEPTRPY